MAMYSKLKRGARVPTDLEKLTRPRERDLYGYAKAARLIASDPEKTGVIFRRFDKLVARNLLYLEARLTQLEQQQEDFDRVDATTESYDLQAAAENYKHFSEHASWEGFAKDPAREELEKRMELATEIQKVLKEYQEVLYLSSQALNLPNPRKYTLEACRTLLKDGDMPILQGVSQYRLDQKDDLCALKESLITDPVSNFLINRFPLLFAVKVTESNVLYTSAKRLAVVVSLLSTAAAFGLLFGAIAALHDQNKHPGRRLGILAGFVLSFAICVSMFTGAKRTDIFAATAAYAAVLVVYVSGPGSGS